MGEDEVVKVSDTDHGAGVRGGGAQREAASSDASRSLKGVDLQAYIGRQLRAVYDDVARQPVPDRFVELMKKLESNGA